MTDHNNKLRIVLQTAAVGITLIALIGGQLISWGAMKERLETQSTAMEEIQDAVIMHTAALHKRVTIQETKFDKRLAVIEQRLWEMRASLRNSQFGSRSLTPSDRL